MLQHVPGIACESYVQCAHDSVRYLSQNRKEVTNLDGLTVLTGIIFVFVFLCLWPLWVTIGCLAYAIINVMF